MSRYLQPDHAQLDNLDVHLSAQAIRKQLDPGSIEVSIAGDMPLEMMKPLALAYLGSVPAGTSRGEPSGPPVLPVTILGKHSKIGLYQCDSDERAMGYIAGPAPNSWGILSSGSTVTELLSETEKLSSGSNGAKVDEALKHRQHPAFAFAALKLIEEVIHSSYRCRLV